MTSLLLLAPLFLVFELWQLVVAERYVGLKQIARGADPRALGPGELVAFCWSAGLVVYWLWMVALLSFPSGRAPGLGLLAITAVGFSLRRNCRFAWVLVVLTFEGAVRIGLLVSLSVLAWRQV